MTEDQIERTVERWVDRLDARLMAGLIDQATYNKIQALLAEWADHEYSWNDATHRAAKRLG
jgi:hypothetical protein